MSCQFCFALAPICLYSPLIALFFITPITHHQLHSSFISPITSCITSYWIVYSFIIVIDKVVQCNYNCLPFQALNMDTNTKGTVSRKSYEIKDKRNFVLQVDELIATGLFSRLTACLNVGIPLLYYSRWKKLLEKVDALNSGTEFMPYNTTGTSCKIHPGRESVFAQVKEQLQAFTFQLSKQGVQVTNRMVMREAARLLPGFKDKTQ